MSAEQAGYNPELHVEKNPEGKDAEFLFSRLHTPEIKKQICDLIYRMGQYYTEDGKEEDEDGNEVWPIDEFALSYEDVETQFNEQLEEIEKVTDISYDDQPHHNSNEMHPYAFNPLTGKKFTTKELGIIEAHEKGHVMRPYDGPQYDEYFLQGFDLNAVNVPEEQLAKVKKSLSEFGYQGEGGTGNPEDISDEEAKQAFLRYVFLSGEAAERMNQLKNYFGFQGNEVFTKEHLNKARQHYISDTGMDNGMAYFFQAITPETEDKFLDLINNSGI